MLVQDPQAIIADEPVASLDPTRAQALMHLLRQIAEEAGKTLISSLHSVELIRANFTRIVGLREGRVTFDLPVDQVSDDILAELYNLGGNRDGSLASVP